MIVADTLLLDGRVITLDLRRPTVTALAVGGGRILAVGTRADVKRWRDGHRPPRGHG